jgi:hypothetical protein
MLIMDIIIALQIILISGLLLFVPPIAALRTIKRKDKIHPVWIYPVVALVGPFISCFVLVVLMWLPTYSGQCGGWLGETSPCGFGQYAIETMYWAVMSMLVPGFVGIALGVVVLVVGFIWRCMSRSAENKLRKK